MLYLICPERPATKNVWKQLFGHLFGDRNITIGIQRQFRSIKTSSSWIWKSVHFKQFTWSLQLHFNNKKFLLTQWIIKGFTERKNFDQKFKIWLEHFEENYQKHFRGKKLQKKFSFERKKFPKHFSQKCLRKEVPNKCFDAKKFLKRFLRQKSFIKVFWGEKVGTWSRCSPPTWPVRPDLTFVQVPTL